MLSFLLTRGAARNGPWCCAMGLVLDFDDCGDVTILAGGCISRRFSSFIFSSTSRMMMFGDGEGRGEGIRDDFKDGGGGDLERALGVFCLLF